MPDGSSSAAPVITPGPSAPQTRFGIERIRPSLELGGRSTSLGSVLIPTFDDTYGPAACGERAASAAVQLGGMWRASCNLRGIDETGELRGRSAQLTGE